MNPQDEGGVEQPSTEPEDWAKEACVWAVEQCIFKGNGVGNFRWRDSVTRQELATVLHRMYGEVSK